MQGDWGSQAQDWRADLLQEPWPLFPPEWLKMQKKRWQHSRHFYYEGDARPQHA